MTTLGKIIGGGMPLAAYGGKAEIMDKVSPQGPVYQAEHYQATRLPQLPVLKRSVF